jgi:two-component system, OmpR family, sensor histidine kinase KdpD
MWIAQAFVAANGGMLDASSEGEGRGTIVAFRFPISAASEPQIADVDNDDE